MYWFPFLFILVGCESGATISLGFWLRSFAGLLGSRWRKTRCSDTGTIELRSRLPIQRSVGAMYWVPSIAGTTG
jgi:hypothetical protein